jgi:hypothetical protein
MSSHWRIAGSIVSVFFARRVVVFFAAVVFSAAAPGGLPWHC